MKKKLNPSQIACQKERYSPWARQLQIMTMTARLGVYLLWDRFFCANSSRQKQRRAKWLVNNLVVLGPTFIKIGQALSTRADLLPLEFVRELSELQDRVPAFDSEIAIATIETELGKPIYNLFREFNPIPLASASLGQVHKARLHSGEDVVVKVQRPDLEQLFNLDFEVLHRLLRWTNRYFPWTKKYNLEEIYREFFELLYQEIDYIHEGKNAERFRNNFKNYERVLIPLVYWSYTTKTILTLEYLPGIKIDDVVTLKSQNINTNRIIEIGISCYLKQLLQDGFFQSDPHPGNMAVSSNGQLIFYDFGTMTEVKSIAKDRMMQTFLAILKKDTDEVVETLTYMGLIERMPDMTSVKRLVRFILDNFRDKPIDIKEFERIGSEVYAMFEQQPFRLAPQMTFIIKSLTTLDGIARALDPQYNLLAATGPFVKSIALTNDQGNLLSILAKQTKQIIQNRWQKKDSTTLYLQRLESKLELGDFQVKLKPQERDRTLKRIQLALESLIYTCLSGFSLVAGTILLLSIYKKWAIVFFCFSAFWFLVLIRSLILLAIRQKLDRLAN